MYLMTHLNHPPCSQCVKHQHTSSMDHGGSPLTEVVDVTINFKVEFSIKITPQRHRNFASNQPADVVPGAAPRRCDGGLLLNLCPVVKLAWSVVRMGLSPST